MANEEPLVIVETRVDVVWEVIRKNCGDGHDGVVGEGETPLRRSGCGSVRKRVFGTEDRYVGHGRGICGHWGSKVFTSWGGDENIVRVNGNILVEWSKEESVEDFLSDPRRHGRHC